MPAGQCPRVCAAALLGGVPHQADYPRAASKIHVPNAPITALATLPRPAALRMSGPLFQDAFPDLEARVEGPGMPLASDTKNSARRSAENCGAASSRSKDYAQPGFPGAARVPRAALNGLQSDSWAHAYRREFIVILGRGSKKWILVKYHQHPAASHRPGSLGPPPIVTNRDSQQSGGIPVVSLRGLGIFAKTPAGLVPGFRRHCQLGR